MSIDTITIALIFSVLSIGTFISFKILNITDLTIEASYGFGAAIAAVFLKENMPHLALFMSFLGGAFAGFITSILHTKLKINPILSGIITLTMFYSINLIVTNSNTVMSFKNTIFPENDYLKCLIMLGICILIIIFISLFFSTKLGLSLRACGDNLDMIKTLGISEDLMKIIGLSLSNALVGLSGALFVEFQKAYFSNMERGVMVVGVASIIIGEVLIFKKHNLNLMLIGITLGSLLYRVVYSLCLKLDFISSRDLELIQSLFLIVILVSGILFDRLKKKKNMSLVYEKIEREKKNA